MPVNKLTRARREAFGLLVATSSVDIDGAVSRMTSHPGLFGDSKFLTQNETKYIADRGRQIRAINEEIRAMANARLRGYGPASPYES